MVFEKGEFFSNGGFYEAEFVRELVVGIGCEVVFFDVGFLTVGVDVREGFEEGVEGRKIGVEALDVGALVVDVAFEAGNGEGEGIECEGEVVGFVGKGAAEVVFDAAGGRWLVRSGTVGIERPRTLGLSR